MRNLERHIVETGRVIHRRYLLQRLIKQGQSCAVYQGHDQVLQRSVAVKVPSVEQIPAYRAAIKSTSQFSHPNIIGLYDLIVEPESIYIVQEYVEGDTFATLLQAQLTPYQVADLGVQICRALLYAGSGSRKICHGDLTPSSILRDRRGGVRVSNFALPSDLQYFTAWSAIGGDGIVFSDQSLPWGQQTDGRRSDDTRAVAIVLYQLLAGRAPDATTVDPPSDRRLRFMRNVPPELCEVVARAVVRQHPQYIATPEDLHVELKRLAEALEPQPPPLILSRGGAGFAAPTEAISAGNQFALPGTGPLGSSAMSPVGAPQVQEISPSLYRPGALSAPMPTIPASPLPAALSADMPPKLATARHAEIGRAHV